MFNGNVDKSGKAVKAGKNFATYYYCRKKRFRWRNVKRLQGHLTNAKDSEKTRVRRKVRTEYLSDAIVGRAVKIVENSTVTSLLSSR